MVTLVRYKPCEAPRRRKLGYNVLSRGWTVDKPWGCLVRQSSSRKMGAQFAIVGSAWEAFGRELNQFTGMEDDTGASTVIGLGDPTGQPEGASYPRPDSM